MAELDDMRQYFARKGVSVPVGSLVGAIERNALQPAPAGCVASLAAVALAKVRVCAAALEHRLILDPQLCLLV
jgi:hypothetical protein